MISNCVKSNFKSNKKYFFIAFFLLPFLSLFAQKGKIYIPNAKQYNQDTINLNTGNAAANQGQALSKDVDTSVDYDMDDLFNADLTDAERAEAKAIIDIFSQQIKDDSTDVGAYTNRGAYWAQLGLHVKAIEDFNTAINIDPTQPILYYNRALSKARFFYTYDACLDLKYASDMGLMQADKILQTKCGKHKTKLDALPSN